MDQNYSFAFRAERCNSDIFSPYFPGAQLLVSNAKGKYVSDFLDIKYIEGLLYRHLTEPGQELDALLLVAQTGKGKNHWVIYTLRRVAMKRKQKILYLCNRVALSRQQRKEVAEAVDPTMDWNQLDVAGYCSAGNITIMTYHTFWQLLQKKGKKYFSEFNYCVADEAHFFYLDCMFNADTERILKSIPEVFRGKFRIYMTATPECIYDLVYWAEWNAIISGKMEPKSCSAKMVLGKGVVEDIDRTLPILPVIQFEYDYSPYRNIFFFENKETIIDQVISDKSKEKWIIFVSSKKVGREIEEELTKAEIDALYIDRESRSSADIEERLKWEYLMEEGKLGSYRVLITTSVLDNGFSIKDKEVGKIVLFTDEKTEFLQELGRVRLEAKQKVKLYLTKMNAKGRLHPNARQKIVNIFGVYYGSAQIKELGYPAAEIKPDKFRALDMATREGMGFVRREEILHKGEVLARPYINNIARYSAGLMAKEAKEYREMKAKYGEAASMRYKSRWLCDDDSVEIVDKELPDGVQIAEKIEQIVAKYRDIRLKEESEEFVEFSNGVKNLFASIFPRDTSLNTGRNRKAWKHDAVNNHFRKISEEWEEIPLFELVKTEDKTYMLVKQAKDC